MIKVSEVKIKEITCEERCRKDVGDLESLKASIETQGLLEPIILDENYNLIAGERRFRATEALNHKTIPARIVSGISHENKLLIELVENIERKDFTWVEELDLRVKIHNYYTSNFPGWSYRDSSKVLGISIGQISSDLEIYQALEYFPELSELKTKNKARETYKRLVNRASAVSAMENLSDQEKSKLDSMLNETEQAPKESKKSNSDDSATSDKSSVSPLIEVQDNFDNEEKSMFHDNDSSSEDSDSQDSPDSPDAKPLYEDESLNELLSNYKFLYKVCDWKTLIDRLPDGLVGFCEIDPPYAMNFNEVYGATQGYATNEYSSTSEADWDIQTLSDTLEEMLPKLYDKLRDDSWVLLWTAIENVIWINKLASDSGFRIQQPGFWIKPSGSSNSPKTTMISNKETFLLFRKKNAQFNTPSFPAAIEASPVHKTQRFHQWQKPIELYTKFFKAMHQPRMIFFSPFAGSGMSMITAIKFDMIPVGCDVSPKYFYQFYTNMKEYLYEPEE